ncbi:hypothetical protein IWX47DRAFT_152325 [Phyllosticta citricarpa]|uniref:Uncharacterized protein n=1 Tax=Phyllosticta citricarpa TaxID=55181 RepID=A0ABR1MBR3_9PEZI
MGSSFWSRAAGAVSVGNLSRCPPTHSRCPANPSQLGLGLGLNSKGKGRGSDITGDGNAGLRLARVGLGVRGPSSGRGRRGGEAERRRGGRGRVWGTGRHRKNNFEREPLRRQAPSTLSAVRLQPSLTLNLGFGETIQSSRLTAQNRTLHKPANFAQNSACKKCTTLLTMRHCTGNFQSPYARSNKHRPTHKLASFHQPRAHHVMTTVLHTSRQWECCRYSRARKTRKLSTRSPARRPGSWSTSALGI